MNTPPQPPESPTQDDRILAAVAHASPFLGMGIVVPLIVWYIKRHESPFVRFQALQALVWQFAISIGSFMVAMLVFCGFFTTGILSSGESEGSGLVVCPLCFIFVIFGIGFVSVAMSLYAAIVTFLGSDFEYPVIGPWLRENYD